ncbi:MULTISPECIES: arsenate reductase (glutaredoxin) [Hyphobacterium]|uniref:Arsenate reductase n=1 Tax=Hyphobacterium vulgare TaxID=1736751 RepID=A0ABV6ZWL1_9PROT
MSLDTPVIWHNPRCTKSRQTLALMEQKGISPRIRLYLEDAPSEAEIREVVERLGLDSARDLMRVKEAEYKQLGLDKVENEDKLVAAMAQTPKLIERPVVIKGERAVIGRPPEDVLDIL